MLGLRPRNQHGGGDKEVGLPELLVSGDVLQGLAGGAAGDELVVLRLLGRGKLALGVGEEIGAIAAEDVEGEHFRMQASLVDFCSFEFSDGRAERLAELHGEYCTAGAVLTFAECSQVAPGRVAHPFACLWRRVGWWYRFVG